MNSLKILSPAKLNLFLRVTGQYRDGYHRIVTLFHRISLADTLVLKKRKRGFSLQCRGEKVPRGSGNIVARAYALLRQRRPGIGGVSVRLRKRIPVGAGLGGGSSNAAAFLAGMNRLYRLGLSRRELVRMGGELGADVPFFLYRVNQALGRGRGEKITPKRSNRRHWFILGTSKGPLSTKRVYQRLKSRFSGHSLTKVSRSVTMLSAFLDRKRFDRAGELMVNDLASPAVAIKASIQEIINQLLELGAPTAQMSGSGPTVFSVVSDRREAGRIARRIARHRALKRAFVCHTF